MDVRSEFETHETVHRSPATRRRSGSETFKNVFSVLILVLAVGLAVLMYVLKPKPADKPPDSLIPQVRVAEVTPYTGDLDLALTGTVVPHREVRLAAEVSGRVAVKSPACRAGSQVAEGDQLMVIDRENYELALRTAEAELNQARIMVDETGKELEGLRENVDLSKEQVQLLEDEHKRNERLGNVVSRSELDQSRRAWLDARSQLSTRENLLATILSRVDRMTAAIDLAQRRVERAQLDLQRTEVKAPFDGVIVRDLVEQDDFVQLGTPLVNIEDTQRVEVLCNLTESDLQWIRNHAPETRPGQTSAEAGLQAAYLLPHLPVTVADPRDPTVTWQGRLDRFDGIGRDEMTKAIPARILVEQPVVTTASGPRALVRGMFVRCGLKISQRQVAGGDGLLTFPAFAVRPGGFVWIVEGEQLRQVIVDVVENSGAEKAAAGGEPEVAIARLREGGLKAGDRVVVSPLSQPANGTVVRIEGQPAGSPTVPEGTSPEIPAVEASPLREANTPDEAAGGRDS